MSPFGTDKVLGLDGHDGSGKSTIARALAEDVGGTVVRAFGGKAGKALMAASDRGDSVEVLQIGREALIAAVAQPGPLILDRSWLTVASLVPAEDFTATWDLWIPTVLCWADLPNTLARLSERDEPEETRAWHEKYLTKYLALAERHGVPVLRTDQLDASEAVSAARRYCRNGP